MSLLLDEALLDDAEALAAADRGATLLAVASAGAQVRMAVTAAEEADVRRIADDGRPRCVVVAALGSSAMVGDLLNAFAGPGSPVPVQAVHSSTLPGWVGPVDLVVAVSLSGRRRGPARGRRRSRPPRLPTAHRRSRRLAAGRRERSGARHPCAGRS